MRDIPQKSYGILQQNLSECSFDEAAEQVRNLGYAILDSGFSESEIAGIAAEFERTRTHYVEKYGEAILKGIDEFYTIRSPLTHGGEEFLKLALNANLLSLLKKLIRGEFILNQQNGSHTGQVGWFALFELLNLLGKFFLGMLWKVNPERRADANFAIRENKAAGLLDDPFLNDNTVFGGETPVDLALDHDKYLYED